MNIFELRFYLQEAPSAQDYYRKHSVPAPSRRRKVFMKPHISQSSNDQLLQGPLEPPILPRPEFVLVDHEPDNPPFTSISPPQSQFQSSGVHRGERRVLGPALLVGDSNRVYVDANASIIENTPDHDVQERLSFNLVSAALAARSIL